MLKLKEVNVKYGIFQALWDVSINVNKGEITAIVGSNGAGKTTLLKTIVGLLKPVSGIIELEGERIDKLPTHLIVEKGISLCPQERLLFPKMTVLENLQLGGYIKTVRNKIDESLKEIYKLFPILKQRSNQLAGTLSGGEQRMLAIARSLMSRPRLLMLDEPSFGLAPRIVGKIFETICTLRDGGISILLVEQNVSHTLEIADKAYVLESGRIVKEGKGIELLGNEYIKRTYLGV